MKLMQPGLTMSTAIYKNHCDNIAAILTTTVWLWRARRRIRHYLRVTGAGE
jgi:hypothetical protein